MLVWHQNTLMSEAGMQSMVTPISNPGPDSSTETIQAELDAIRAFAANQMPDKHKEIDLLAKAYKDLEGKIFK